MYYLYIIRCANASLYTGITTNLERRIKEHNESTRGAKFTRSRRPVVLVYSKKFSNRSTASKAESAIKKLPRTKKIAVIKNSRKRT